MVSREDDGWSEPGSGGNGLPPLPRQPTPGDTWQPQHSGGPNSAEGKAIADIEYHGDRWALWNLWRRRRRRR